MSTKKEIALQLVGFVITATTLGFFARTNFGIAFSLLMGALVVAFVRFAVYGKSLTVSLNSFYVSKITNYGLCALSYVFSLFLLLLIKVSETESSLPVFFQTWGATSIQDYIVLVVFIGIIFLFPGFFILRVIDKESSIKGLDSVVFSFILSSLYTPVIVLLSLVFLGQISLIFYILTSMALLAICILAKKMIIRKIPLEKRAIDFQVDLFLVIIVLSFVVASFAFSQDYAYTTGSDIWRHQGTAISIIRYGIESVRIPTTWFNINIAFILNSSVSTIVNSVSALNLLNIFPIIAFYCLTRKIFARNQSGPGIATAFFAVFSGLGWIYALYRMSFESWINALINTSALTANDTTYSNLWNWGNNPFVFGFVGFFMLLSLLFGSIRNRKTLFVLTFLTYLMGWATHIAEAYIFIVVFGVVLFFCKSVDKKAKTTIFAALIFGTLTTVLISILSQANAFSTQGIFESYLLLAYLITSLLLMFALPRISTQIRKINLQIKLPSKINLILLYLILILWLLSYTFWIKEEPSLWSLRSSLAVVGFVPWYVYPVRLGAVGILAIFMIFIKDIIPDSRENLKHLSIFLVLGGTLFIFGSAITIAKISFIPIDFWEIRILRYPLSAITAIIGAMFVLYIINIISRRNIGTKIKWRFFSPKILAVVLLSLLVISGTMSTLFSIDYSANITRRSVDKDNGVAQLLLNENASYAKQPLKFFSIADSSKDYLNRFGLISIDNPMNNIVVMSPSAEANYFGRWFTNGSLLFYMPEFDDKMMESTRDSFLNYTIKNQVPQYYSDNVSVYSLPEVVPSFPNSSVLYILSNSLDYDVILDALARTKISYTTALPNAISNLDYSTIILPNENLDPVLRQKLMEKVKEGMTLVIFNAESQDLLKRATFAPIDPESAWKISVGSGQLYRSTQNNQTVDVLSGRTDDSGIIRVDYSSPLPLNLSDANSFYFKFISNTKIPFVRFALFDSNNNYGACNLPYDSIGDWAEFRINIQNLTDTSGSMNFSSVQRVRIGTNVESNSSIGFSFSGVDVAFEPPSVASAILSYKNETFTLPFEATVPTLNTESGFASYVSNGTKVSPLLVEENYGYGKILYVNSIPLLTNKIAFPEVTQKILTWVQDSIVLPKFDWTQEEASKSFELYSKRIVMKGTVSVDSNSLIFNTGFDLSPTLQDLDSSNLRFSINASIVEITPSSNGVYSSVSVVGPFDLLVYEGEFLTAKYKIIANCTLQVKNPHINTSGETQFEDSYWRKNPRYWGVPLIFKGDLSFDIYYSGNYLLLFNFNHNGDYTFISPYADIANSYLAIEQIEIVACISIASIISLIVWEITRKKRVP